MTKKKQGGFPPHVWELFKNPQPDYEAHSWETEEQVQKNRQGFVIATGASFQALATLAEVFDPEDVRIQPIPKKSKRRRKTSTTMSLAAE
jgi:hypothetical protein